MFYPAELHHPRAIVLNPGFDIVWRHLQQRWRTEEKKWNEDDPRYIRLACEVYEPLRENPYVLYIDHEINLTTDNDTKVIKEWLVIPRVPNHENHSRIYAAGSSLAPAAA